MPNSHNTSQANLAPRQGQQQSGNSTAVPRNVSFAQDSNESTAYREHNPPAVLRRQEAARREMSPVSDSAHQTAEDANAKSRPPVFSLGGGDSEPQEPNNSRPSNVKPSMLSASTNVSSEHRPSIIAERNPSISRIPRVQENAATPSNTNIAPVTNTNKNATSATNSGTAAAHPVGSSGTATPQVDTQLLKTRSAAASRTSLASTESNGRTNVIHNPHINIDAQQQTVAPTEKKTGEDKQNEVHILVAVTGSVATIKLPQIIHKLKQVYRKRALIQVVVTKASTTFFDPDDLPRDVKVWYDSDEWKSRQAPLPSSESASHSDQQLHIRLRRWADIFLVAPCSANTLAKFTFGICDNLLTSIFRVWNPEVPILLAPAMNTHMYTNPVTKLHYNILKESYPFVEILKPVEKVLVCGDIGMGGMREWMDIVQILVKRVGVAAEDDDDEETEEDSDEEAPKK